MASFWVSMLVFGGVMESIRVFLFNCSVVLTANLPKDVGGRVGREG